MASGQWYKMKSRRHDMHKVSLLATRILYFVSIESICKPALALVSSNFTVVLSGWSELN